MNQEVKALWVEALLSGKYKQGLVALRNRDDEFCCLGVLCEIAVREGVIKSPRRTDEKRYSYGPGNGNVGYLPEEVVEWAGMETWSGRLPDPVDFEDEGGTFQTAYDLATLNDDAKYDFVRIAEIIEEQF